jgi:hypothetical protein
VPGLVHHYSTRREISSPPRYFTSRLVFSATRYAYRFIASAGRHGLGLLFLTVTLLVLAILTISLDFMFYEFLLVIHVGYPFPPAGLGSSSHSGYQPFSSTNRQSYGFDADRPQRINTIRFTYMVRTILYGMELYILDCNVVSCQCCSSLYKQTVGKILIKN